MIFKASGQRKMVKEDNDDIPEEKFNKLNFHLFIYFLFFDYFASKLYYIIYRDICNVRCCINYIVLYSLKKC